MRGSELDKDAQDEIRGYAEDYADKLKIPSSQRKEFLSLIYAGMMSRFYVRNLNEKGDVSPKTGKELSLIHPSRRLGYEEESEAENRNKTQVESAARNRRRFQTTVDEMSSELTEEVAQEEITELAEEVKDSNMKQEMDNMDIYMEFAREIYLKHTKLNNDLLSDILKYDNKWMNSTLCLEYGLVDKIL